MRRVRWSVADLVHGLGKRRPEPPDRIIVGLGNPGSEYADTRHNVGFRCIDRVARDQAIVMSRRHRMALIGEGAIEGHRVVLAKPRTFVNRSGEAVSYLLTRYRVSPGELLVVCDDMDLPIGKIRLRVKGGSGGHRGLGSIIDGLGTQGFARLRVGIGRPIEGVDEVEYVLGAMSSRERETVDEAVERVGQAVVSLMRDGVEASMSLFN